MVIEETMAFAAQSIRICVYTISDNRLVDAIMQAHREGMDIKIISDNDKAFDKGSDVLALAQAGLDVRVDASPNHMHHKFLVADDSIVVTGSYNWTRSAEYHNNENLVRIDDSAMAKDFLREFDQLWNACIPAMEM